MYRVQAVSQVLSNSLALTSREKSWDWMLPSLVTRVDDLTALQLRLAYEVSGVPGSAAVLFCDHPQSITIGRQGSRLQVAAGDDGLKALQLPLHYVPRGNGAMLHVPGQITCYPILPIAEFGYTPGEYVRLLLNIGTQTIRGFDVPAEADETDMSIRVQGRRIAHLGVAVRLKMTVFGLVLNLAPDLELFRGVRVDGDAIPMTSIQHETIYRVTAAAVRQKLLDRLADEFSLKRAPAPLRRSFAVIPLNRHAFA